MAIGFKSWDLRSRMENPRFWVLLLDPGQVCLGARHAELSAASALVPCGPIFVSVPGPKRASTKGDFDTADGRNPFAPL